MGPTPNRQNSGKKKERGTPFVELFTTIYGLKGLDFIILSNDGKKLLFCLYI